MIFLIGCTLLAFGMIVPYFLNKWRYNKFIAYMDNIDDNLKRMPAEAWILNGEYSLDCVDREYSMKEFDSTNFWDHDFKNMIIFKRKI